ncbi:MAG: hypothetical protein ABSC46_09015 [Candidatus Limnocylindrales bacterium]|jgi:hypothetical protein
MSDKSSNGFGTDVDAGPKDLGTADPLVVERVQQTVEGLPDRSRRPGIRSLVAAQAMLRIAAAIAVVAVVAVTLQVVALGPAGSASPTIRPTESAPPVATSPTLANAYAATTASPGPTLDLSPGRFASDPRMLACEKAGDRTLSDVLYAFALSHGKDYRADLQIPVEPGLASAEQPALVVVFKTGTSDVVSGPGPMPGTSGVNPEITPPPDARTVCVGLTGVKDPVLIRNLDKSKIVLPPARAPSGPIAGVFANTNRALAAMTWDAARQSLWIVTWNTGPNGQLTRAGLDGSTKSWPLPNGPDVQIQPVIQAGLVQPAMPAAWYGWDATDVVVDGQGKVWIAAGYGLVRFDPDTGKSQLKTFPESDATKVYGDGGQWLSAIAADGNGVLIARNGESALTRIDESLANAGTIALPATWTGVRGIAVLGDRIVAGGPAGLGVFDRNGAQLGSGSVDVQFASLRPIDSGRAAVLPTKIGITTATAVDSNGRSIGTFTIPMEPIHGNLGYQRLVVATDWTDHVWYGEWDDEQPVYLVESSFVSPR